MSALPAARTLAWHEAHHVAPLLMFDWPPLVARIDWPEEQIGGSVRPDWDARDLDERRMRELLISVLMGPISEGCLPDLDWPIVAHEWAEGCRGDAKQIAFLVQWLGLDRVAYMYEIHKARALARERPFRKLVVAISAELERVEVIFQPELIELAEGLHMTQRPDTHARTHDEMGILILDDERDQVEADDPMFKALDRAYRFADAVRDKSLPIEIKTFAC